MIEFCRLQPFRDRRSSDLWSPSHETENIADFLRPSHWGPSLSFCHMRREDSGWREIIRLVAWKEMDFSWRWWQRSVRKIRRIAKLALAKTLTELWGPSECWHEQKASWGQPEWPFSSFAVKWMTQKEEYWFVLRSTVDRKGIETIEMENSSFQSRRHGGSRDNCQVLAWH